VLVTAILFYPYTVTSYTVEDVVVVEEVQYNPEDLNTLINYYADKYGVSRDAMYGTIRAESGGTYDPTIQSRLRYDHISPRWLVKCPDLKVGDQERSYGLVQIHICDHDITIKQATDPRFALDFMAKNFALGNESWWMGYKEK